MDHPAEDPQRIDFDPNLDVPILAAETFSLVPHEIGDPFARYCSLEYRFFKLLLMITARIAAELGRCAHFSGLETCSWINYDALGDTSYDNELTLTLNSFMSSFSDPCYEAYRNYWCAAFFPRCDQNHDIKNVCKSTCEKLLEDCPEEYWGGLTPQACEELPEVDCTSNSNKIVWAFPLLFVLLLF